MCETLNAVRCVCVWRQLEVSVAAAQVDRSMRSSVCGSRSCDSCSLQRPLSFFLFLNAFVSSRAFNSPTADNCRHRAFACGNDSEMQHGRLDRYMRLTPSGGS